MGHSLLGVRESEGPSGGGAAGSWCSVGDAMRGPALAIRLVSYAVPPVRPHGGRHVIALAGDVFGWFLHSQPPAQPQPQPSVPCDEEIW